MPTYITMKEAVALVEARLRYGRTWFFKRIRPVLEERGAIIALDYSIAHTGRGKRYQRRGVRVWREALEQLLNEMVDQAARVGDDSV